MSRMGRLDDLSSVVLGSSKKSFINTVCKFVRDVDEMNSAVLVPSMLNSLGDSYKNETNANRSNDLSCDLQTLHSLLNRLKDELTTARFDDDNATPTTVSTLSSNLSATPNSTLTTSVISSSSSPVIVTSSSSTSSSSRLAEDVVVGISKKFSSSCKCTTDSDDGFSSLTNYSRTSDDESNTSSSSSSTSDSDSELYCSTNNQVRETDSSSPEYIVNLLRLHIQGIQSILNRFSKYADQVSDSYNNSLE